jgi:hypothetical protein
MPQPIAPALPIQEADPQLLFGIAQELASRHHNLALDGRASREQSHPCRVSYALRDGDGRLIVRIPIEQLEQGLRERSRDLLRLLRAAGIDWRSSRAAWYDVLQLNEAIKKQPYEVIALTWAISKGHPYPRRALGPRELLTALLLLLCFVIPGLVYLYLLARRQLRHQRELERLATRWRREGMPDPDRDFLLGLITRPEARSRS